MRKHSERLQQLESVGVTAANTIHVRADGLSRATRDSLFARLGELYPGKAIESSLFDSGPVDTDQSDAAVWLNDTGGTGKRLALWGQQQPFKWRTH